MASGRVTVNARLGKPVLESVSVASPSEHRGGREFGDKCVSDKGFDPPIFFRGPLDPAGPRGYFFTQSPRVLTIFENLIQPWLCANT